MAATATAPTTGLGPGFFKLVTSSGLSNLADGIFKLALPLTAVKFTRSPTLIAGVALAQSLPWLVFALHAGALADRLDRRRAMVGANTARGLLVALPAGALLLGLEGIWLLYVVAFAIGLAEVLYDTTAQTILPTVVDRSLLSRANGRLYAVELGANQFIGPPLAGFLVAAAAVWAFTAPALLWIAAVGALLLLKGQFRPEAAPQPSTLRSDIAEGLRYLAGHRLLRLLAAMTGTINITTAATGAVLVLFAVGPQSPMGLTDVQFGLLATAGAVGSVLATFAAEHVERAVGRAWSIRLSTIGMTIFVATPALTADPIAVGISAAVGGLAVVLWNIPVVSFRQTVVPDRLLGRVNSAYRLLAWGSIPLGAMLGGAIAETYGLRPVFALMGLVTFAVLIPALTITDRILDDAEASA